MPNDYFQSGGQGHCDAIPFAESESAQSLCEVSNLVLHLGIGKRWPLRDYDRSVRRVAIIEEIANHNESAAQTITKSGRWSVVSGNVNGDFADF